LETGHWYRAGRLPYCDAERPNLITDVHTTAATVPDDAVTATIHATLAAQVLLPERHIADTGFVNSKLLVDSEQVYRIDLIGPTRADHHWQAKTGLALPPVTW
jgi:transposase